MKVQASQNWHAFWVLQRASFPEIASGYEADRTSISTNKPCEPANEQESIKSTMQLDTRPPYNQ